MKYLVPALALGGLVLAACAHEEPEHHGHRGQQGAMMPAAPVLSSDVFLFLPYDANHDHRIDRTERDAAIAGAWSQIAGSADTARLIQLQDWFPKAEGAAAPSFNPLEFDVAGGDSVTRDQFAKVLIRRFERLDRNGDGVLEPSEFLTVLRVERDGGSQGGKPNMQKRRRPAP